MKEVFTKSFWKAVKQTFDEAREGDPPVNNALPAPAEGPSPSSETAPPPPDRLQQA